MYGGSLFGTVYPEHKIAPNTGAKAPRFSSQGLEQIQKEGEIFVKCAATGY